MVQRVYSFGRKLIARWRAQPVAPTVTVDPRVQTIIIRSTALGIPKRFFVYTPPGFKRTKSSLPALYLFRGHEREWVNPREDGSRQGRTVIDVYEELLTAGAVGPMLLVFPGISSDDNTLPGLLVNFKQPPSQAVPGIGNGRFEDYFLRDLLPYVERYFRTSSSARSVDGFSLGGFMATKIAAQYPDQFASVGAYDGLFFWDDPGDPHSIATTDQTFRNPIFDPAFGAGANRDRRYAATNNSSNLVRNGDAARLQQLAWLIEYGPKHSEPDDSNFYRGDHLCTLLQQKGIENRGRGEIKTGTHTWQCADEHMRYVLPLHWQALQQRV